MKKIILTAAIAFSVGMLSLLNIDNSNDDKVSTAKVAKVIFNQKHLLATAD